MADAMDMDDSILLEFVEEAMESLEEVANFLISLEQDCLNVELVNAIFRPIHSIKGNAAFFDLMKVKKLAHIMEDLLDAIRKREFECTDTSVDLLMDGNDMLIAIFTNIRAKNQELHEIERFDVVAGGLSEHLQRGLQGSGPDIRLLHQAVSLLSGQMSDAVADEIKGVVELYMRQVQQGDEGQGLEALQLSPLDQALEMCNSEFQGDLQESFLETLQDLLFALLDEGFTATEDCDPAQILQQFMVQKEGGFHSSLSMEMLAEQLEQLKQSQISEPAEEELDDDVPVDDAEMPSKKSSSPAQSVKTMRIPEQSVDDFLSNVGELIVIREMFEHVVKNAEHASMERRIYSDLRRNTDDFSVVLGELERSCMELRYQTMGGLLQKVPRIVRDVAKATGKNIVVETSGEDISADKTIIATLEDPLVHMVRNACDHGVESPETRLANGKEESGTVHVHASEDEEFVYLRIGDDGAGLNLDALRKKGVEMEHFSEDQQVSEADIIDVLFQSGISTAEEVTDISGRGVGMDVVKRYVEEAGGRITVENRPGEGSDFIVRMPKAVATQIINGMNVRVGDGVYVIPVSQVIESFVPDRARAYFLYDKYPCVKRFGKVLPIILLKELFDRSVVEAVGDFSSDQLNQGIYVCVEAGGHILALHVDEIIGIQQVVLKPLLDVGGECKIFTGGALMGDGSVSLIIDVDNIYKETQSDLLPLKGV